MRDLPIEIVPIIAVVAGVGTLVWDYNNDWQGNFIIGVILLLIGTWFGYQLWRYPEEWGIEPKVRE